MFRIFLDHETTEFKTIQDSVYDERRKERVVFDKLITIKDTEEKGYDVRFFLKNYAVEWKNLVYDNHILNVKIPMHVQKEGFREVTKDNIPRLRGDKRTELTYTTLQALFKSALDSNNFKLDNNVYYVYIVKSNELNQIINDDRQRWVFLLWKPSFEGYLVNYEHIVGMYYRKMWVGE